jgi:peptide/nickel transport system substrate-binding protein
MRTTPIPGTGPYRIAYAIRKETRYVRNPFFHEWSHAAQPAGNPDVIVMRYGMDPTQELRAVERGEADWSADDVPAKLLSQLTMRYASRLHSYRAPIPSSCRSTPRSRRSTICACAGHSTTQSIDAS